MTQRIIPIRGYISPNETRAFVEVHKVASTSMHAVFREQLTDWTKCHRIYSEVADEIFSIVREPFSRYCSGVLYWWAHGGHSRFPDFDEFTHWLYGAATAGSPHILDIHTEPQWRWHRFTSVYFALGPQLETNLSAYLDRPVLLPHTNTGSNEHLDKLKYLLGQEQAKSQILNLYAKDLELYESAR